MAKGPYQKDSISIEITALRLLENTTYEQGRWTPPLDCYETEDSLMIELHLPGVALHDIDLTLEDNQLIIRGKRAMIAEDNVRFHRIERPFGVFERTIALPFCPDEDNIKAVLEQGVLRITIKKIQEGADDKR